MSLAIFDLDNTLITGDSDYLWGEFLVEQNIVEEKQYREQNQRFYDDYKAGTLDIYAFLAFSLAPLARLPMDQLAQLHAQFMLEKIIPLMPASSFELINYHKKNNDYSLIITATNRFVTQPIAEKFGVHDIIATEPEIIDGRYTGQVAGTPCFKEGKVKRLEEWLKNTQHNLDGSWFYSDSHNDLPLLELVSHPVAVNADDILLQHARLKGWKIMNLH